MTSVQNKIANEVNKLLCFVINIYSQHSNNYKIQNWNHYHKHNLSYFDFCVPADS